MIYTINTFEIALDCNSDKFTKLQNRSYDADYTLAKDGFEIEYHDSTYKKKIKLVVNPAIFLGGYNSMLWEPNGDSIQELIRKLEKYIDRCFGSKYNLDSFTLTNIDFSVNIDVGDRKTVAAYIKVLRNIGRVKGFSPMQYEDDTRINGDKPIFSSPSLATATTLTSKPSQTNRKPHGLQLT